MREYGEWRFVSVLGALLAMVLVATLSTERLYREQALRSQQEAVFERLGIIRYRLESELTNNLSLLTGLAAFITANPDFTEDEYARYAAASLNHESAVLNLAAAPDLVVRHIFPVAGNEAVLGLDYRQSRAQWPEVEQVVERRATLIAGPVELVQGGTAFVGRVPVLVESENEGERLWGIVAAPMRVDEIFAAAGLPSSAEGLELAIRKADVNSEFRTFHGSPSLFEQSTDVVVMPVNLGDMTWQLAARSAVTAPAAAGVTVIRLVGLVVAVLVLIIAVLRRRSRVEGERMQRVIEYQANHDLLTGLPNRNLFNDRLSLALLRAKRAGTCLSVLFIDLDDFKSINDTLGHSAGDDVLKGVAERLLQSVRATDTVARFSGDEFVVLLEEVGSASDVGRISAEIVRQINQPIRTAGGEAFCGVSIGAAFFPEDGNDGELLVARADQAMYKVKESGRNGWQFFTASMQAESESRQRMYDELLRALAERALQVWFQPMLDASSGLFTGCEALVRWQAADGSWVAPDEFVALAEERGLVSQLDQFVLEQALLVMGRISPRLPHPFYLSVNISSGLLRMQDETSRNWLHRAMSANCQLMVEIPEGVLLEDAASIRTTLEGLSRRGVEVAINDFGAGYSGLGYFSQFPIRVVKMDRSLVSGIGRSDTDEHLIESILLLAERLEVRVIAEGVETPEQMEFLKASGCHFMQGYHLARPMAEAELVRFLVAHSTNQDFSGGKPLNSTEL